MGPGKDLPRYFLYRSIIGVDAQVADCVALQGFSDRCRLFGDPLETRNGPADQLVAGDPGAVALSAEHDPML